MYIKSEIEVIFSSHFPNALHWTKAINIQPPKLTWKARGDVSDLEKAREKARRREKEGRREGEKEARGREGSQGDEEREWGKQGTEGRDKINAREGGEWRRGRRRPWPWKCQGIRFYRRQFLMLCSISLWIMFMMPTIFFLCILEINSSMFSPVSNIFVQNIKSSDY